MVPWRNSRKPRQRSALAPAAFVDPCLPSRADKAPSADGWIHEIKHDGFRLRIHVRSARARYGSPANSLPSSILRLTAPRFGAAGLGGAASCPPIIMR